MPRNTVPISSIYTSIGEILAYIYINAGQMAIAICILIST